ncbi:MAG: hypothetical protein ACTSVI_09375 [Promethearchaeota archaeon]
MELREKILSEFKKILSMKDLDKNIVIKFLFNLYKYIYGGILVIGEKNYFSIKKVEGETFFNQDTRTLYLGIIDKEHEKYIFEVLVSLMQYYHHEMNQFNKEDADRENFKDNLEKSLALDYLAAAITHHFLGDFPWPGAELGNIMKEYGLIDELLLIKYFATRYIDLIEYEGDFKKLLDKIKETIKIFNEIYNESEEDKEMLEIIKQYQEENGNAASNDNNIEIDDDKEKEEFMKSLLEAISLD